MKHFLGTIVLAPWLILTNYGMNVELKIGAAASQEVAHPLHPAFARDFKDKEIIRIAVSSNGAITAVADKRHVRLYDNRNNFMMELLPSGLSQEDLVILDIALDPEGSRLVVVGRLTGSDKKLLFVCDSKSEAIRVRSQHALDDGHPDTLEKSDRAKLLMLDNKNVLVYSENYIELWYLDTLDSREFRRKMIFSYVDFPADVLPGRVKNKFESKASISIQTVLFLNQKMYIFYFNSAAACYAITTMDFTHSSTIGLEEVIEASNKQEIPLGWAVKFGSKFATAQLVTAAGRLFIYCDDLLHDIKNGIPMSDEFFHANRSIIGRPSGVAESRAESRLEESTERKQEERRVSRKI